MIKIKFRIPESAKVIVRWFRNNKFTDTKIPRPANNEMLRLEMLRRKVGFSEIRAVKADRETGTPSTSDLRSLAYHFGK